MARLNGPWQTRVSFAPEGGFAFRPGEVLVRRADAEDAFRILLELHNPGIPLRDPDSLEEALEQLLEEEGVKLDCVLNYDLPIDEIVSRLGGRRTCEQCKAVFHVATIPPKVEGVCDHCGGKLLQREDDRPESIRVRMDAYQSTTKPLADFYEARGLLKTVSADGAPGEIFARTLEVLE